MIEAFRSILFVLFLLSCSASYVYSQAVSPDLQRVRMHLKKGEYDQAHFAIRSLLRTHPNDPYVRWSYATTLNKMGNKRQSYTEYDKAIELAGDNVREITMDYGRILYEGKKYREAMTLFDALSTSDIQDSIHYDALVMKSYTTFLLGDFKESKQSLETVFAVNPDLDYLNTFYNDLNTYTTPFIKLSGEYMNDNQPLNTWMGNVEAGFIRGKFFNPKIRFSNYNFDSSGLSNKGFSGSFSNSFLFPVVGTELTASLGVFQQSTVGTTNWTAGLQLDKKLAKGLNASLFWNHLPYLGTNYSVQRSVVYDQFGAKLSYDHPKIINFNLQYSQNKYDDANLIKSVGGWVVSGPISTGFVKWRLGYSLSFSDADKMNFIPNGELSSLIEDDPMGLSLPGVYAPYYTPSEEIVNSVIGDMQMAITSGLNLSAKITYGFKASNNLPYLYYNQDDNGDLGYLSSTYKTAYNPYNFRTSLDKTILRRFTLELFYQTQKTFYYTQNQAGIALNYRLL